LRFVIHLVLMFVVALGLGFGLSWYALTDGRLVGARQLGPWVTWPAAGSPNPDPYTRAYLARTGALQLGQSEGLQYVAQTDSDGEALERACNYRIEGRTPTASFWTLVPADPAGSPVTIASGPPAFHSSRIARDNDGTAVLHVGPQLRPGNWLETAGRGPLTLVLTLYDVAGVGGASAGAAGLPAIMAEGCS
jgi:hypothetical protein